MIISAAAFGLIVGGLLGLVGGGGSILAVPALVYGVGLPLAAAIPTSLVVVGASSAVAVLPRLRNGVNWRLALIIGAAGTVTAYLGAVVNRLLDPKVLLLAFAAIMVFAGIRMLMPSTSVGGACALPGGGVNWRSCLPKAIATGAVVGFLTGLLGVGGGFLIVPALTLVLGLPMALTVGTSLVIIVINSAAGFAAHLGDLQIDWAVTAAFAVTAMAASLAAGRIGTGSRTGPQAWLWNPGSGDRRLRRRAGSPVLRGAAREHKKAPEDMSSGAFPILNACGRAPAGSHLPPEKPGEEALAGRLLLLVPAATLGARDPAHDLVDVLAAARPRRLLAFLTCHRTAHLVAPLHEWIVSSVYPLGYFGGEYFPVKMEGQSGVPGRVRPSKE